MSITTIEKLSSDREKCQEEIFEKLRGKRFFVIMEKEEGTIEKGVGAFAMMNCDVSKIAVMAIMSCVLEDLASQLERDITGRSMQ